MTQWPNGGMKFPKGDIRSPFDFAAMAKLVRPEDFEGRMVISQVDGVCFACCLTRRPARQPGVSGGSVS